MYKNIENTSEKFYIITLLPITAYSLEGDFICSNGFNNNFHYLLKSENILSRVKESLISEKTWCSISIPGYRNSFFSACFIDPKNIDHGFYILGPHTCNKNNRDFTYKPKCLIPHLIDLLYNLEDKCCRHKYKQNYSYHVRKALNFMNSYYHQEVSLSSVSNFLKINKSYLSSLFKKEMGKTFTETLNEIRIERSKELLLESDCSILDIALNVGYNNQNYFNIAFKKYTNMTPMQFRNKNHLTD